MSGWWYVVIIVVLVAGVILYLRTRQTRTGGGLPDSRDGAPDDFRHDREESRRGHLSEEDRVWEMASLRKAEEARERRDSPGEP